MQWHVRTWCTVAILCSVTGCGDSTGPGSVVGTYSLQTVDGLDLPTALVISTACEVFLAPAVCDETLRLEVRDGTAWFDADSTYRVQTIFRRTDPFGANTEVTSNLRGDWSFAGGQISLVDTLGTQRSGTVAGGTVTIDVVPGSEWVYRK